MSSCTEYQSLITLVASGAAGQDETDRLSAHAAVCPACQREWDALKSIVSATARRDDPGEAYWSSYQARLETRMQKPTRPVLIRLQPALQWAAALALITLGVLLGRSSLFGEPATTVDPPGASSQLAALDEHTYRFLERSRTVLLAVANFTPGEDQPEDLDLDRRRAIAGQLVSESADLQTRLTSADQQRLSQLIADLEIILLQLANLDAEVDIPQLEMLQHGVNQKAILFKIDVESMGRPTPGSPSSDAPRPENTSV